MTDRESNAKPLDWLPTDTTTPFDAALTYVAHGWSAIPLHGLTTDGACMCVAGAKCGNAAKHPWLSDWQKHRRRDADDVRGWFRSRPRSGVGLAMGGPLRLVAIDIDGAEGRATWDAWQRECGAAPPTLTAKSGRIDGGAHHVFRIPDDRDLGAIRNRVKPVPGIDVRSEGGQIVVAPTLHQSGRRYVWTVRVEPAPMPEWLFERLANASRARTAARAVPPRPASRAEPSRTDRERRYAEGALTKACDAIRRAPEGERNDTLYREAASIAELVAGGTLDANEAHEGLDAAARDAGLRDDEVRGTLRSAFGAGARSPRGVPPSTQAHAAGAEPSPQRIAWEPAVPLDPPSPLAFPLHSLPPWAREWTEAVAHAYQVPADLPGALALAVVALALARRVRAAVKPAWSEHVSLYVFAVLATAERKSAVYRAALAPVDAWEERERERLAPSIRAARDAHALADGRVERLRRRVLEGKATEAELAGAIATRDAIVVPPEPRLVASDVTPEKLAILLSVHGERMGVFATEATPIEVIRGRYSDRANTDIWCQGFTGDPFTVDRVGRESIRLREPILTLAVCAQPHVLESLRESPELRERGLLGRCLYVVPPQRAGWRDVAPNVVAAHYERVVSTYALRVTRLLDLRLETQANVSFASEARVLVEAYSRNVEPRLRPGGDLADLGGWGGRLPGLLVRFATLLYVAGEDDPTSALARPLPASAVEAAIPLADWATGNALVAFDVMATAGGIVDARYLLAAIRRRGVDTVTRRDLHHWTEHRFPRAEDLDDGIGVLVERGYLRERASAEARTRGRPASPTYDVRPTEPTQMPPAPNSVVSVGKVDPYDAAEREAIAATDAPDTIRALAPAFDEWVVKLGRKATDAEQLGARLRNAPPPRPLAELRERDPSAFDRAARESVERWSRSRGATP